MPDLGGLANRLRSKGKAEPTEVALVDEPDGDADESDVTELVERLKSLVDSRRPPAGPVAQSWSAGVGDLLAEHPKVPKRLRGLVRKLDRFGGLEITPEHLSFDGDDVKWSDVTEVRTRHLADYLLGDAVQRQLETIPLPPFPGRRKLFDALGRAMLTVTIAITEDDGIGLALRVPAEVEYKASFGRRKTFGPGALAAIMLADPSVSGCLTATAEAHGIPVKESDDAGFANATERAAAIRAKVAALHAELARFSSRFGRDKG